MAKFIWEDGTLVSKAKVEIGGTIYEVDPEEYSGTTPLSANNLNTMQDGIYEDMENKTKKDIITAYPRTNLTLSGTAYETIPLDRFVAIGDELTVDSTNTGIKVGKAGTVKISAKIAFQNLTAGLKWLTIYCDSSVESANPIYASGRTTLSCPPLLSEVSADQIISLQVQGVSGDEIRNGKAYTEITVEYVDYN